MYKLIAGKEGCGKTQRIIEMANEQIAKTAGDIVFIDDNKHHILDLKHKLRFISMDEFPIETAEEFYGFLCGIISNNYDVETIYIDGLQKMVGNMDLNAFEQFVQKANKLAEVFKLKFVYTVSGDEAELPESLKANVI
jgi:hypothetical protein